MKKVLLTVVLLCVLSCSNDETKKSVSEGIVGKWHLVHVYEDGSEIFNYSCNSEFNINEYTENGNSIIKYADKDAKNICKQYTDNGVYSVSEGILTETQKNGSITIFEAKYKIKEVNDNNLKLETISLFESNENGSNPVKYDFSEGEEVKVYNHIN